MSSGRLSVGHRPFKSVGVGSTPRRSKKENRKLTKKELIRELNRQKINNNEEIFISVIKKNDINNEKAIPELASIDFIGGEFINIRAM